MKHHTRADRERLPPRSVPGSMHANGPYRFTKPPIVLFYASSLTPTYEVYVRLNRDLPYLDGYGFAGGITVNGASGSTTGLYQDAVAHCYQRDIDDGYTFPKSLLHPKSGQIVTVKVTVRKPPRGTVSIRVPIQPFIAQQYGPSELPYQKLLGCVGGRTRSG